MKKIFWLVFIVILVLVFYNYLGRTRQKQKLPVISNKMIQVSSPAFTDNQMIPKNYTCDDLNINPPLSFKNVPVAAKSLALIVDDPDAPMGTWTHWLVWNIDPKTAEIKENSVPVGAVLGKNDSGENKYDGPCPPGGTHRYFFRVYALDTILSLAQGSSRKNLESAMSDHVIDQGELMSRYSRQSPTPY